MNNSQRIHNKNITIGYFCPINPFVDKRAWSGTFFKIREAIEKGGFKVIWIPTTKDGVLNKLMRKIRERIRGGDRLPIYSWLNSLMIERQLETYSAKRFSRMTPIEIFTLSPFES